MHAVRLLHTILNKSAEISCQRLPGVMACVNAAIQGSAISLSSIAQGISGSAKVKNKTKRVDGILGNGKLNMERKHFYKATSLQLIGANSSPYILIDWSPCITQENYMLRASILCKTNSFVLYEEVHKGTELNKTSIHDAFLKTLAWIMPSSCKPIIVTDAGFPPAFQKLVVDLNWDFVSRLRSSAYLTYTEEISWFSSTIIKDLMSETGRKYLGEILLSKRHKLACHLVIIKEEMKGQKNIFRKKAKGPKMEREYKRSHDEPWVIITSLIGGNKILQRLSNIYGSRMKIEHEFRKVKNEQLGLGLARSKTRCPERLQILLLITMLAMFAMCITGVAAEEMKLQFNFQANTVNTHRVISVVSLGKLVLNQTPHAVHTKMLKMIIRNISSVAFEGIG